MTRKSKKLLLLLLIVPLLAGCGRVKEEAKTVWEKAPAVWEKMPFVHKDKVPTGATYPPAAKAEPIFQTDQVPAGCKVFAHLLIWTPAGANGRSIASAVEKEAMRYGADMILIGRSRKAKEDQGMDFAYYGPDQPYSCQERWAGWKFGYEDWSSQGDWASMGYEEWGRNEAWFDAPLVMQAAFLRCQEENI